MGSHGVFATANGFVCPMGTGGILHITPREDKLSLALAKPTDSVGFHSLSRIGASDGMDMFVAACRTRGTGVCWISSNSVRSTQYRRHSSDESDIVSAAAIKTDDYPFGFVSLASDGTLFFVQDARRPGIAKVILPKTKFRAYKVIVADGNIFVLSRDRILVIENVSSIFDSADGVRSASVDIVASDLHNYGRDRFALELDENIIVYHGQEFVDMAFGRQTVNRAFDGASLIDSGERMVYDAHMPTDEYRLDSAVSDEIASEHMDLVAC